MKFIKIIKYTIILICLILNVDKVYAYDARFNNLTVEDGLSQSTIDTLFQDSKGNIWIGTNSGLNKYNGSDFEVYTINKDESFNISSNYITSIDEDSYGNIWVGTSDGLNKIAPSGKIKNYFYDTKSKGEYYVNDILVTKNNCVLVASNNGISKYDEVADEFKSVMDVKKGLKSNTVYTMEQDSNGLIWIGTHKGITKLNLESQSIENIDHNKNYINMKSNMIKKIYYDSNGYIWVSVYNRGLYKINVNTDEIKLYNTESSDIASNKISDIKRDSNGNTWIATDKGLCRLGDDDKIDTYLNIPTDKYSILSNNTISLLEDSNGLIWVGTDRGTSTFNPKNKIGHYTYDYVNENSLSSSNIRGIYEDDIGYTWIGTKEWGLNVVDKDKNIIRIDTSNSNLNSNNIRCIEGMNDGILVGTDKGVSFIDINEKSIKNHESTYGSSLTIYKDDRGYIWCGYEEGMTIYDTKSSKIVYKTNKIYDSDMNVGVTSVYQDQNGYYWIGTNTYGKLVRIIPKTREVDIYDKSKYHSVSSAKNAINHIQGHGNELWIGTNYGILNLDIENQETKLYTTEDGLSSNIIQGILIDDDENIWASTNNGISIIYPNDDKVLKLNVNDGLQGNEFSIRACFKRDNGNLLFGGVNGVNEFNTKEIYINPSIDKVQIDNLEVNGKRINYNKDIKLKYTENNLDIEFFLPSFNGRNNITYMYKVEGKNEEWRTTKSNQVRYYGLDPGNYKFVVKAINSNGIESGKTSFNFKIIPPIWENDLFILLFIISVMIVIRIIDMKIKSLDELVKERTSKLTNEMTKNIVLERRKNNYFINLSHELRTPLNVISMTLQFIKSQKQSNKEVDIDKLYNHIEIMEKNSKRLMNLINNIIDTSKIEHGHYEIVKKDENISQILKESISLQDSYLIAKNISLITYIPDEERMVSCFICDIERCFINLINNSIKFTHVGGVIEIGLSYLNEGVNIYVKDNGIGIHEDEINTIFDRFNQVVDDHSELKGGTGLGLTITKHIIDLHGGRIMVKSQVNRGSTFTIYIPYNDIKNESDIN